MHMSGVPGTSPYSSGAIAGLVNPAWKKIAWIRALQFILLHRRGATFTATDMRAWCETEGQLPAPEDSRAYGFITRLAKARKLIRDSGQRASEGSHGRECVLWEVCA